MSIMRPCDSNFVSMLVQPYITWALAKQHSRWAEVSESLQQLFMKNKGMSEAAVKAAVDWLSTGSQAVASVSSAPKALLDGDAAEGSDNPLSAQAETQPEAQPKPLKKQASDLN